MAVRDITRNYLREAKRYGDTNQQLEWLESVRTKLTEELDGGGQSILSTSYQGQSSSMDSGVSVRDRLQAVNNAIDRLSGEGSGGGRLIIPQLRNIPL